MPLPPCNSHFDGNVFARCGGAEWIYREPYLR